MDILKKILITFLFFDSIASFASDDRTTIENKKKKQSVQSINQNSNVASIWAGVAGAAVGMVAGVVMGSWLADNDAIEPVESHASCCLDLSEYQNLSPKALKISQKLNKLMRYGQFFDLQDNEQAVITTLHKLGIHLHDIDANFYIQLQGDYKTLSDIGYSIWWHNFKDLEAQKNLYLANSQKIVSFFRRHYTFIQACQIINSYDQLLSCSCDIINLVSIQGNYNQQYPLIDYKNKIESDVRILRHAQSTRLYPVLAQKFQIICNFLDSVVQFICRSNEYQHQIIQKKQDELRIEFNRIEQEKLDIARQQIKLQEETNRILAEKNRIEAERFFRDRR